MDQRICEERLTRIHALIGEGYDLKAYGVAQASKAEYLASEEVDPLLLGWLRYYEFKSLVLLEAWREAYELFRRPERVPFHLAPRNAAWMHLAAAECATRLGRAEDVVRWAERAYELRRADVDPRGAAELLRAACRLLERVGRSDLNTTFADKLIELGLATGAESALIEGMLRLLENYEAKARPTVGRRLRKGGALLPALRDAVYRERAAGVLERLNQVLID